MMVLLRNSRGHENALDSICGTGNFVVVGIQHARSRRAHSSSARGGAGGPGDQSGERAAGGLILTLSAGGPSGAARLLFGSG